MMDRVKGADGHTRWILGPVEMSIVAAIPTLLLVLLGYQVNAFANSLNALTMASVDQAKQLAVANVQMQNIGDQLADMPGLAQRVSRLEVRMDGQEEISKELRAVRGLK
jgi:hypothetical protein